jgi:hypothetical protein
MYHITGIFEVKIFHIVVFFFHYAAEVATAYFLNKCRVTKIGFKKR